MGMGWYFRGQTGWGAYRAFEISHLAVIGGSEPVSANKWRKIGEQVADLILKKHWTMLYCGMGTGLSGLIANRIIQQRGKVKAVTVRNNHPPDMPSTLELEEVDDFFQRTQRLVELGEAFLVLPGGVGTLDELTFLAAWHGVGLLSKPVVLFDPVGWFDSIIDFYEKARKSRITRIPLRNMFRRVTTLGQVHFHPAIPAESRPGDGVGEY